MRVDVVIIGIYEEGALVGALPGFLGRRGPFQLFGSPLRGTNTSYMGPILLECASAHCDVYQLLEACSNFARKHWGAAYTEFTLREAPAERNRPRPNWEPNNCGTYCLDLSKGQEALWSGMTYSARRHIRKSERLGLRIVPFGDGHMYYQMLDETFARHGSVDWHSERFFQALLEDLVPQNLLWSWGVEYEGRIIAAGLFLHDDQ